MKLQWPEMPASRRKHGLLRAEAGLTLLTESLESRELLTTDAVLQWNAIAYALA